MLEKLVDDVCHCEECVRSEETILYLLPEDERNKKMAQFQDHMKRAIGECLHA